MTDFYISAIRMDKTGQHIEFVKVIKAGNTANQATLNSRQFVAELINTTKVEFKTIRLVNNKWIYGSIVKATSAGYITTAPNGTTLDNLGNLPTF
ncbi:DUF3892 domain-containing protein [Morganella morganii]|uniref:DUF3892 domain-containing protein n=1 Tax=Morganella morganii TaxID=582 RepID=UPI00164B4EE8|nr:DUF3892 domain-containing protein [Morganella morganii]MBC4011455.1 DUF3892 domain-containing protein [Morganella morganii]